VVAALLGAQISTTGVAAEVDSVFLAANHLLSAVFT
jgi:hypothetical protein